MCRSGVAELAVATLRGHAHTFSLDQCVNAFVPPSHTASMPATHAPNHNPNEALKFNRPLCCLVDGCKHPMREGMSSFLGPRPQNPVQADADSPLLFDNYQPISSDR
jgi:hypothetical protein